MHAFVADGFAGASIFSISNPAAPQELSNFFTAHQAWGADFANSHIFLADDGAGLVNIDVSNPADPQWVGAYGFYNAWDVTVVDTLAYVGCGSDGLRILDVSDPANPAEVGFYNTPGVARGIEVVDTFAYIADGTGGGLRIYNIVDPTSPQEIGFYDSPGDPWNVAVADTFAYLADGTGGGLRIVNIADPSNPQETGFYDTQGLAKDIAVSGTYAFLADGGDGLLVFDVSNPSAPQQVAIDLGWVWGVKIIGDLAYLAGSSTGMRIVDISNPLSPFVAGMYTGVDYSRNVAIDGPYVYIANGYAGMQVFEYLGYGIDDFSNGLAYFGKINLMQNPVTNNDIHVKLQIPMDVSTGFTIYDRTGSCVKHYDRIELRAGSNDLTLPVHSLPAGVYFLKADIAEIANSVKIMLIR